MYTRVVQATIKPDQIEQFKDAITHQALPAIHSQPGFVDAVEMYSGDKFVCVTFWRTQEDAERYTRDMFPRIAEMAGPLLNGTPQAETYEVENDTIHKLGRVA